MQKQRQPEYELVPLTEDRSFAVREFRMPRFASPWHVHPEFELTLIRAGTGTRFVGDSVAAFGPGDLALLGPDLPHYWRSADPGSGAPAHSLVIQFRENCLGADFFRRPELRRIGALLGRARRGVVFGGRARIAAAARMTALPRLRDAERVAEFIAILALLARASARPLSSAGFLANHPAGDERVRRACRHVFENLAEPLRLADAARAAAMTPTAFCRHFKRATGRRFFDFVNDARIGHACAQLIATDQGVGEIAFASGFNSLANFNRRFRERQGMSPRAFRRLHHDAP